jgi:ferrous iron transport protein B
VVVVLSFLNSIGTDGSFGHEDSEKSVLSKIGKAMTPVFRPMGMREENWPAAVGIFTGIFAKEAIVGTLNALYSSTGVEEETEEEGFDLMGGVRDAFATVPANLRELKLPFSLAGLLGTDGDEASEELEVEDATHQGLRERFDGQAGAFAYLLMVLLYMPCVAAIGAVYRELNFGWTVFSVAYLSALAWLMSTLFYQVARFSVHPETSLGWIAFCITVFAAYVFVLRALSVKKLHRQKL